MGRFKLIFLIALNIILFNFHIICAQQIDLSNFSPVYIGFGGRSLAMGGTSTAYANDATAIACNPAGLAKVYKPQIAFSGRFTFGSIQPQLDQNIDNTMVIETTSASRLTPEFASIVFPMLKFNRNIVGGIAVRNMFDLSQSIYYNIPISDQTQTKEIEHKINGDIYAFSPSIGIEISPYFSMGFSFNFLSGRDKFSYLEKTVNSNEDEFIDSTYTFENKFSGFSCDIGLTTTIFRKLSFGCVVSTPFTLKLVGITESINNQNQELGDTSLNVPMFMSIGAAYQPINRLLVAMDFRWLS